MSGVVASLGTDWGLLRHYWIALKRLLTMFATVILLIHIQPIDLLADAAVKGPVFEPGLQEPRRMLVFAAAAALVAFTGLSTYKPRA